MAVVTQPVLPLIPIEATPIGPITALVEKPGEGGVVYVNGLVRAFLLRRGRAGE